jgi:hypothetical protein
MGRYITYTEEKRIADKILVGNPGRKKKKNDHLEDPCIDGRINEYYKNMVRVYGRDSSGSE